MTRYLLADTHFGDPGPLEYADKPFGSVGAMNDALVERWNAAVSDGDVRAPGFGVDERVIAGAVVVVAVDQPTFPVRRVVVGVVDAQQSVAAGLEAVPLPDLEGATPPGAVVVVARHEHHVARESPEPPPERRRFGRHREVADDDHLVAGRDDRVPPLDERVVHRADGAERSVGVPQRLGVAEVGVGDEIPGHRSRRRPLGICERNSPYR